MDRIKKVGEMMINRVDDMKSLETISIEEYLSQIICDQDRLTSSRSECESFLRNSNIKTVCHYSICNSNIKNCMLYSLCNSNIKTVCYMHYVTVISGT